MTAFVANEYVKKEIKFSDTISGNIKIDGVTVKFIFSSYSMDGDIATDNEGLREIIKVLIPTYVFNKLL